MAEPMPLVELLLFYSGERTLFNRMVCSMGKNSEQVKGAIALWLSLEEIGYHNTIRSIHSQDDKTIEAFLIETLSCLEYIKPNANEPTALYDTPVFQGLLDEPMNYRFFYYNREFLYRRHLYIMETVCNKIFGETAAIEVDESGPKPVVKHNIGQGSEASTRRNSNLNASAPEFLPGQIPKDARKMFITFSASQRLTRGEIINFFTSQWGEVVQDVFLEKTREGGPQFGNIIFTKSTVIAMILNGQPNAKFLINGKHLWARRFVSHHVGK